MPIKPKYYLLLCFVLFPLLLSAQEADPLRKNHFGFGGSFQYDYNEEAKGCGLKIRYERGKRGIRIFAAMETEKMAYKNSNVFSQWSRDNGWGSWRWRKDESHHVNVFSNMYSIGVVLRSQQTPETVRAGLGFNLGYHQKMIRSFKEESCTITYSNYFGQMWQNPSSTTFPPENCDAKQSVNLANSFFAQLTLHFEVVLQDKSELDLSFGAWLPTQKLNQRIGNRNLSSYLKTQPLYQFKHPNSGTADQTTRLSFSVIYFPRFNKRE